MNIKISKIDTSAIEITLSGRFDAQGAGLIKPQFLGAAEPKSRFVIVDLAEVDFLASAGLRLLLIAAKLLEKGEGKLVLARPRENILRTLNITGIDSIIPIYKSVKKAKEAGN